MLMTLIATFFIGIAAAGITMISFRVLGKKPPRWIIPSVAGAAMLSFHIWNEYAWFERAANALPKHVIVAEHRTYESILQPWTLLFPRINQFIALDRTSIRRNKQAEDYVIADTYVVTRLEQVTKQKQIYDCDKARHADITRSVTADARGLPTDVKWSSFKDNNNGLLKLVCTPI